LDAAHEAVEVSVIENGAAAGASVSGEAVGSEGEREKSGKRMDGSDGEAGTGVSWSAGSVGKARGSRGASEPGRIGLAGRSKTAAVEDMGASGRGWGCGSGSRQPDEKRVDERRPKKMNSGRGHRTELDEKLGDGGRRDWWDD
jgi:hypothetical protein